MKTLKYSSKTSMRMDKFILSQSQELSFAVLQKYLRQNKVKLNGKKAALCTKLVFGDEVQLYLPDASAEQKALAPQDILFEDENLLALYKPAGLVSLNEDAAKSDSLQSRAKKYLQSTAPDAAALLCHRLDTGTSGVLLLAKNTEVQNFVLGLIREKTLEKTYIGLTFGHPKPATGVLDFWLFKDAKEGFVRAVTAGTKGAKPAQTHYSTIATKDALALLQIKPQTGRTHQIRAHFAHFGTPLLGDSKYGDNAANRRFHCKYQCLCAQKLCFPAIDGAFKQYSGMVIACPKPWFYSATLSGKILQV